MPRINLTDGRSAIVTVKKSEIEINKKITRRRIAARILIFKPLLVGQDRADIDSEITAQCVCSEKDIFDPKFGRQESVRRLLKTIGGRLTKTDRETVIKTLCPELFVTNTERLRAEYERLKKIFEPEVKIENAA